MSNVSPQQDCDTSIRLTSDVVRRRINVPGPTGFLAAYLYTQDWPLRALEKKPAVVTAPGFGGVKEMLIESYAIPLVEAGYVCLSLDYRSFGESEGDVRQDIDPEGQVSDLRAGIDYLEKLGGIDSERLGVWGTSMAGGHTISLAATDTRIKAAVALMPFLVPAEPEGVLKKVLPAIFKDAVGRWFGKKPGVIPIFAEQAGDFAVMTSDGGWEWMQHVVENAPTYRNEVTIRSLLKVRSYRPAKYENTLSVPTLLVSAETDSITLAEPIESFSSKMPGVTRYISYPGSHFELFGEHLQSTASETVKWFQQHL